MPRYLLVMTTGNAKGFGTSRENFPSANDSAAMALAESGGGLPSLAIPASVVLRFVAGPAALWSGEPESAALNAAAAALFGFAEDSRVDSGLWLEHVEPRDRDAYEAFRRRLRQSSDPATFRYRFLPRGTARAVELRETALCFTAADGESSILSRYTAVAGVRFAHKLGNHLQAIRGEIDLLRLSGALPQAAGESIARSIEAIHRLADEMEKS